MNDGIVKVDIEFTPRARAAEPRLARLLPFQLPTIERLQPSLVWSQEGDTVRIEGIPTDIHLVIVGRGWTVMADETRLAIVLDLL